MIKQSKQVIVVTDSSKIGNISPALICPSSEIHTIITNTGVSPEALAPFERQGIRIIKA
jgi:DeoR family transcriptional regulator of aga operon